MGFKNVLHTIWVWFLSSGLKIILIAFVTLIIIKVVSLFTSRLTELFSKRRVDEESKKRAATLSSVIKNLLIVVILVIALITVLGEIGIEIGPILAAAGIVGLAVGFGAQSLVKDVINGFFILLEDQIREGDIVQIAGKGGLVERVTLKMTVLRDLAGTVHFIPNGHIDVVSNMTKGYSRYIFDVGVAYRENVDEVIDVMKEVDEDLRNDPDYKDDILEPIEILGLDKFDNSAVIIRARTMTKPSKQWRVGREFNRRLKRVFDERNIEIPFPHVTLYMGKDKQDTAAPLHILMEEREKAAPNVSK
ncbi:MAG: mechanosensitive ion channel family protein [Gemmatimonadota bacterium]|nr:MAG: mechanosensitive ion channel family protein [Gemmatimonadota bacterium]